MKHHSSRRNAGNAEPGAAIIVAIAMLVMISFLVIAFLSRTSTNRKIENSTTSGIKAEVLAKGALEAVIGDLRAEIIAGSTATTVGDTTIYQPTNNQRVRASLAVDFLNEASPETDFANLVKQSAPGNASFKAGDGLDSGKASPAINGASSIRTDTASRNGRKLSAGRWNAPQLLGGNGFVANRIPYWISLNSAGIAPNQAATSGVIGRFAYNVYDVGGLLDVNVAGYAPTSAGGVPADMRFKGIASWADLTALPGIKAGAYGSSPEWLPKWRNTGDWGDFSLSPDPLNSFAFYHQSGWLRPYFAPSGDGDRMFAGRQDLINYARLNQAMFDSPDSTTRVRLPALQYLTTFSRDVDAPTFTPHPDRPKIVAEASGGNDAVGKDDVINPALTAVRVGGSFTRPDGREAMPGEPLLKKRFPLIRLEKVTRTATATQSESDPIYRFFGLSRASANAPWTYDHGGAGKILQLSEVAAKNREPDMVELLKASITAGSLGKRSGIRPAGSPAEDPYRNPRDKSLNYQIIQIAANIIDQFDADGYPTVISFDGRNFYGVENLPLLASVRTAQTIAGKTTSPSDPSSRVAPAPPYAPPYPRASVFYQYQLWNPHAPANLPTDRPTSFRIVAEGSATLYRSGWFYTGAWPAYAFTTPFWLTLGNSGVRFTSTGTEFAQPAYLRPGFGSAETGNPGLITGDDGRRYLGTFLGHIAAPNPTLMDGGYIGLRVLGVPPGIDIFLQYQSGGDWVTYDAWGNYICDIGWLVGDNIAFNTRFRCDPRTNRFGYFGGPNDGPADKNKTNSEIDGVNWPHDLTSSTETGNTIWASTASVSTAGGGGWSFVTNTPNVGLGRFSFVGPDPALGWQSGRKTSADWWNGGWWMGTTSSNVNNNDYVRYTDPDRVLRGADGAFADMTTKDGLPLITGNTASRPIILNRPFQSVAELGHVFRGTPWKTLDFFTPESGDSALLDVFCILEPPPDAITAGRVNLNTRQWPVLKALLKGGSILEDGSVSLTDSQAETIAQALVTRTKSTTDATKGPLLNRSDLIGRYNGSGFSGFSSELSSLLAGPDAAIKHRRESAIRSLTGSGTTRSWNFLIDLVAQSGRHPVGATNAGDFMVEGESRFWLHLSIDRWTGKIIGRMYEPVFE